MVLAGGLGLYLLGSLVGSRLMTMMHDGLAVSRAQAIDTGWMTLQFSRGATLGLLAVAPILGLMLAAAVLAPLAIGGWTFSTEALVPDFGRLDPVAGFGRVFSMRGVIELLKALARFCVVGVVAVVVLRAQFHAFNGLGIEPVRVGANHALTLCGGALIALGGALAAIAMIDVPLALWQYHKSLRMSREEIREENKESEGSPEIKSRVRRAQQALARRRMMQEVPKADVVITNPTHYAVALRYDEARMRAPIVIAKGRDLIALRIRELAAEHRIPTVESPPLARALHGACELGDEIPARLYAAVARVLTYVYQLRQARRSGLAPPDLPTVEVPEE